MKIAKKIFLSFLAIMLAACSNVTKYGTAEKDVETQESKQINKLIVLKGSGDLETSQFYQIQLKENSEIRRSSRDFKAVSIKRYPYSISRKIDEIGRASCRERV